tara:strand:+ start:41 stop:895 length:855 start_codon:yes stop_codon:yes gene_type:complete
MEEQLYDENAIIVPPKINTKDIPIRKYKYIIDSRDRNKNVYPDPAKYIIKLDECITDVVNTELILTDFKFNDYNVTKYSNVLHTDTQDYTIPLGTYDGISIAAVLTSLIPSLTVTFDTISSKLSFVSTVNMEFRFKNNEQARYDFDNSVYNYPMNSVGKMLGFAIDNYALTADNALEAPYMMDLETENYIIMYMQQAKVYQSRNNKAHNAFAIINKMESTSNGLVMFNNIVTKSFNPAIASLTNLSFKFCDYDGNLYDFQNRDHRFEIVFTCFKQTRCYNEIFK